MEETRKITSISYENKNSIKCDRRTYIKSFQKKMLISIICTPEKRKEKMYNHIH